MKKVFVSLMLCVFGVMFSGCSTIGLVTALNTRGYYNQWLKIDSVQTNAPSGGHLYNLLLTESASVKLLQSNHGTPDYVIAYNSTDGNLVHFIYLKKNLFAQADWLENGKTAEKNLNEIPESHLPPELVRDRQRQKDELQAKERAERLERVAAYEKEKAELQAKERAEQVGRVAAYEKEKADRQAAREKEQAERQAAREKEQAERQAAREKEEAAQKKERAEKEAAYAKEEAERQAKEVAEKKKKEAELAAYNQKLKTDPAFLYQERIKGVYALYKGKLVEFKAFDGEVIQVVSSKKILLSQPTSGILHTTEGDQIVNTGNAPVISVIMNDTENLVDNQRTSILNCVRTGTFKYKAITGAASTVAEYTVLATVTYEEFLDLWNSKKLDVEALAWPSNRL